MAYLVELSRAIEENIQTFIHEVIARKKNHPQYPQNKFNFPKTPKIYKVVQELLFMCKIIISSILKPFFFFFFSNILISFSSFFFAFCLFLLQKDFLIFHVLLFSVFLCVFDKFYLPFLYIEKKIIKKYFYKLQ